MADAHMSAADLPEVTFQTPQFAQRQIYVWKLQAKLVVELLLEVTGADIVNHRRL